MVKMPYIITGAIIVVALAIVGAVVYFNHGNIPGISPGPTSLPAGTQGGMNSLAKMTALQAFAVAEKSADLGGWKASHKNVAIAEIASDFSDHGTAGTWDLTYASDTGDAIVTVYNGSVKGIRTENTSERFYPQQGIATDHVIDSVDASDLADGAMEKDSMAATGAASVTLTAKGEGASTWDLSYPVDGGYYVVRLDASSGSITTSKLIKR